MWHLDFFRMTAISLLNPLSHLPTSTFYVPSIKIPCAVCCHNLHMLFPLIKCPPLLAWFGDFLFFLRPSLNVTTSVSSTIRLQVPRQNILLFLMCSSSSLFFNASLAKINYGWLYAYLSPSFSLSAPPGMRASRLPAIQ